MAYNILIVDDSSIVRKALIKTLAMTEIDTGHVYEAENGAKALDVLQSNWVDLIFLDINMPVMNGMEFLAAMRARGMGAGTEVIVVSTEGSKIRSEQLKQLGISARLRKPVRPESLTDAVRCVLAGGLYEGV